MSGIRVCALVGSDQVVPGRTFSVNGARGPDGNRNPTVTDSVVDPGLNTSISEEPPGTSCACGMVQCDCGVMAPGTTWSLPTSAQTRIPDNETYATEIGRPEFGCGLDGLIAKRRDEGRLTGILNGIDKSWDPRADKRCPYLLDAQRWKGRYADFIRGAFGLSLARAPLFAFIARLAHQKGIDLVIAAAEPIVARGAQLVIIGRGEPEDERAVIELSERFPDAVGARVGFDAREARAVFAGADFLLMPSRFEPCGLSQMFAQRFGALPIAHRTGGLAETVEHLVTGVLFDDATTSSLEEAIDKAFDIYAAPRELQAMRRAAMAKSFDWEQSAARYAALYRRLAAV